MATTTMSSSSRLFALLLVALSGCLPRAAAPTRVEVCPVRAGQPLRFVDVFDGAPEELATLIADRADDHSGYWELGYVYDAGRSVTIRCKYADGESLDRKLARRVQRCDYKIDSSGTLGVTCG